MFRPSRLAAAALATLAALGALAAPARLAAQYVIGARDSLTVRVDSQTIFSNVPAPFFTPNVGDRFVWAARCGGGSSEEFRLDNLVVVTKGNLQQVPVTTPYYSSFSFDASAPFDGNDSTYWQTTFVPAGSGGNQVGGTISPTNSVKVYALTSGSCFLYDAHGKLLFSGGITSARGHEGDNAGRDAIVKLVHGRPAPQQQTDVFGCALRGSNLSPTFCMALDRESPEAMSRTRSACGGRTTPAEIADRTSMAP